MTFAFPIPIQFLMLYFLFEFGTDIFGVFLNSGIFYAQTEILETCIYDV